MRMKIRITLTLDPAVSHLAKQQAKTRGTSVSGLVEQLLRQEISQEPPDQVPFAVRWAGKAKMSGRSDQRTRRLRQKYEG